MYLYFSHSSTYLEPLGSRSATSLYLLLYLFLSCQQSLHGFLLGANLLIIHVYNMKLDSFLHLLSPAELAEYLVAVNDFPASAGGFPLEEFVAAILRKEVRELELFKSGSWARSLFWSARGLVIVSPDIGECIVNQPDIVCISVYRDSQIYKRMCSFGCRPTIHPFAYNPEWTECFIFNI